MITIGKPISKTLISQTFDWKRLVHSQNRIHSARLLEKDNYYEVFSCLICDAQTSPYLEVDGVAYGQCNDCNHVQSSIRPTLNFVQNLYGSNQKEYSPQDLAYVDLSPAELANRAEEIAAPKVEWVKNLIDFHPNDPWIDIGSGTGDILLAARQLGFEILGIEASPSEISIAENRSIPTLAMFYDGTQRISQMYSAKVISMFNVLEHTLDPLNVLLSFSQQMCTGSYLVIEVPRINSLTSIVQLAKPKNIYRHIFSPEHLNIFSDQSIESCLNQLSFTREATWYFGSDAIEIFGHISGLIRPEYDGGLDEYFHEINTLQEQIDKFGLSDAMLLIARKK